LLHLKKHLPLGGAAGNYDKTYFGNLGEDLGMVGIPGPVSRHHLVRALSERSPMQFAWSDLSAHFARMRAADLRWIGVHESIDPGIFCNAVAGSESCNPEALIEQTQN
jgi:hypothetical protein